MQKVDVCWLVCLAGMGCFGLVGGCGEQTCHYHHGTACIDGVIYWMDSCGNQDEAMEECPCGCDASGEGCGGCGCQPECTNKQCGPDGCGGVCPPGCSDGMVCGTDGLCACEEHATTLCEGGVAYWQDSCGHKEDKKQDCACGCGDDGLVCKTCDCTPQCEVDWTCGPDGCGGTCGAGCDATAGQVCDEVAHACTCLPQATARCRDDGHVWWFDSCDNPQEIKAVCDGGCQDGECLGCVPQCETKQCGEDGCGGECPPGCTNGAACNPTTFQCECAPSDHKACHEGDVWWFDSCNAPQSLVVDCQDAGCANGLCENCTAQCAGKVCGPDGCGGDCPPGCSNGQQCTQAGQCICLTHFSSGCHDGDIYWYDSCGVREDKKDECGVQVCEDAACVDCVPDCAGKECGPDGCGGRCQPDVCEQVEVCNETTGRCECIANHHTACADPDGDSDFDVYSYDACGNLEQLVADCHKGCDAGACLDCQPTCDLAWECGPDSCGGNLCTSTCQGGEICVEHECLCGVEHPCDDSHFCYQGEVCNPLYGSYYKFRVGYVEVSSKNPAGDNWDNVYFYYAPDIRVCLFYDPNTQPSATDPDFAVWCSQTIEDEYMVHVDETSRGLPIEENAHWAIAVFDDDLTGEDLIDQFFLPQPFPAATIKQMASDDGVTFSGDYAKKLVMRIEQCPECM